MCRHVCRRCRRDIWLAGRTPILHGGITTPKKHLRESHGQRIGRLAGGRTTRTPAARAPMLPRERTGKMKSGDMVCLVGGSVMEKEAATTGFIIEATTPRRAKTERRAKAARRMFKLTSANGDLHRPAAESHSMIGGKMPTLSTPKKQGANMLLRVRGQRRARLQLRVRLHGRHGVTVPVGEALRRSTPNRWTIVCLWKMFFVHYSG